MLLFVHFNSERVQRKSYGCIISTGDWTLNHALNMGARWFLPVVTRGIAWERTQWAQKAFLPIDRSKQWRLLKRQTRLLYLETRFIANPSLSDVFRYLGKMIKARKWRKESFLRVWHHNVVRAAVSLLVLISCVLLVWKWHEIKVTKQIMCVTEERWKVILVRMLYGSFVAEVKNFFATL